MTRWAPSSLILLLCPFVAISHHPNAFFLLLGCGLWFETPHLLSSLRGRLAVNSLSLARGPADLSQALVHIEIALSLLRSYQLHGSTRQVVNEVTQSIPVLLDEEPCIVADSLGGTPQEKRTPTPPTAPYVEVAELDPRNLGCVTSVRTLA